MKGVILAGGKASRLRPSTIVMGKALLPIYNKPMIFHSASLLIESGIDEIYIVCSPRDKKFYDELFKDYKNYGVNIHIIVEEKPQGPGYCFKIVKENGVYDDIILIFSDNLFLSENISDKITKNKENLDGVVIFAKKVDDPRRFGVIEVDKNNIVKSIEEKPENPKSNIVTTGIMLFSKDVFDKVESLKLSKRGEYETTDLNVMYLKEKRAKIEILDDDCEWLDTGTHKSLLEASIKICDYEDNFGIYGSPEVSLFLSNKINMAQLLDMIKIYPKDYQESVLRRIK